MKLLAEEEKEIEASNLDLEKEEDDEWTKWLREKERELKLNEECIPGDLKSLSAQLEKCDEMIAELRNKRCAASSSESDVEMVAPLEGLLRAAETKRNHCVDSINKTQLSIHKAVKLEEIGDQFKRELEWLRRNLSVDESSLKESLERIKYLKTSLQLQEETKKETLNLLEEVAQIALKKKSSGSNISGEQMRERIVKLKNQWKMIENEIEELLDCCNRESQRRANSWLNSLKLLLEELEQALKGSFESATDAEELSEHLDNLERLLDRLGSIEREAEEEEYKLEITEFHPQLIELTKQRESLIKATYERCTQLRKAVANCEHFEQRLCQMHNWGANMQQILNQRLASDTYSLEVPNEYKKIDKEFSEYNKLVEDLNEYIHQSKSEFASTERLKLQLDHANQQLSLLRPKFAEFKQPIGLFERMDRIQQQLTEIESSMDDLAGIESENCEFCLLHLEQIQNQLEELSTDCAACEASRDTLIREGIIEEIQAIKLSAQLSEMTKKCVDELENRVTINIQRLKRAVDFVEKFDRECAVLDKLLGEVENRLIQNDENIKNEKQTQRCVKIIDELYRQLRAATDSTSKANELESFLRNLAIRLPKEKIEFIKNAEQRCSKLRDKLDDWNELINKQIPKINEKSEIKQYKEVEEGIFNEINELAKELDKRFGQLEQLNSLQSYQLIERLNALRPLKERFEHLSLQTVSRKDFGSKVAPLLANLSSRWQNLTIKASDRKRQEEQIKYQEYLNLNQEPACTSPLSIGEISPTTAYQGGLNENESLEDVRDFGQQVQSTIEHFERAKRHLNYSRHPVNNLQDWEQRLNVMCFKLISPLYLYYNPLYFTHNIIYSSISSTYSSQPSLSHHNNPRIVIFNLFFQKIGQYVANRKLNFDVLIAGGKHIAESGPIELLTSAALSKLDELIDLVHNVDEQVEREEQRLHNICQQFGIFNGQTQMARERLEAMEMKANTLNTHAIDPTPVITLQQELMDTSGQMQLLQLSADELRKSLPPTMCEQQIGGDVLDQLNQQLHEIESRVQSALLRALQYRQDEDENIETNEEEGRKELWQPEFDVANVSTSSTTQQIFVPYPSEEQQLETKYKINIDGIASTSEPLKEFLGDEYIEEKKGENIGTRQRTGAKPKEGQRMGEEEKDEEEDEEEGFKSTTTDHQQQRRRWRTAAADALAPPSQIAQQKSFLPPTEKMKSDGQQFLLKRQQKIGEQTGGMDQFYISLNIMEDYIEQQQQLNALPYETFTEKAEMLKDFEMELKRGEQLLNEHLMTMEVGESEHVKARIASLRRHFEEKKSELESRRETIRALEQHYSQCEQMLDELANICKEPRIRLKGVRLPKNEENEESERINLTESRDSSPDLDELEAAQAQLENYLPPIAVRLQQIQNRLNVLSEHLSAAAHNKFQQKLRLLVEDFNERTKEVRIKRDQLEIRLADQTHLKQLLDDLEFWCDESEAILETVEQIGPLNISKIEKEEENIQKRYYSTETKLESFRQLERLKDRFANLVSVEPQVKHEVRRDVANLGKRLSDVRIKLKERMDNLLAEKWSADELWREFAALKQWAEAAEKQIYAVENAKIFRYFFGNYL
ncbi:unnamed protein product [Meloidogyne enterolobii]|uniref:Uncharacterized protein n=1 Tax=Meloidogyne enterolobii TaxID=390850 RepID=A0ACB1ADE7_MELEN